jgi:predicted nucleic acid-binding protein
MYLFDTDTLSNLLKKSPSQKLLMRLAEVARKDQFTTTITIGEMVYGAYKSNRPEYFIEKFDKLLLPNLSILAFDESAARQYGVLRANLEKAGTPISEPDLRIASICLVHDLTLITGNTKHFLKVPELKMENWI